MINSHIYWVKFHSVPSQQQYLWPVATRKGQSVKNKQHCKYNPYLCIYVLFAHRYNTVHGHNMTSEMSLFLWNFSECNVYCLFLIVYFTFVYYLFHLLWQCKHTFPMPIKPFELNWGVENTQTSGLFYNKCLSSLLSCWDAFGSLRLTTGRSNLSSSYLHSSQHLRVKIRTGPSVSPHISSPAHWDWLSSRDVRGNRRLKQHNSTAISIQAQTAHQRGMSPLHPASRQPFSSLIR